MKENLAGTYFSSAHSFKLSCTRNYIVPPTFFFQMIILPMHLYTSDGRHAWFHLHGTCRPAWSAPGAIKHKMKILLHNGTRTHSPDISSLMLYRLSQPGLLNAVHLNDLITYMYSQYQCIPCYKYENEEVERITNLSGKCTVLCYILEYIYIVQITKRRISPVIAFNMQIRQNVWSCFHVESKPTLMDVPRYF